ncbi:ribonuclease H family protein, partial [Acinetobacter baumannii]
SWQPPCHGFLKFNIDGASEGNPAEACYGGVLRDKEGNIQVIFHSYLGKATNNVAELMAMESCLEILLKYNIQNVIIEADSELDINS